MIDITNDVSHELSSNGHADGIAYVSPTEPSGVIRVNERETGFFEDLEVLLERIVPSGLPHRERLVASLLSPRSEQVPFADGALCLGRFQRIMLFSLDAEHRSDWSLTLLG